MVFIMELCSNCGKKNELGSKFCEECGSQLIENQINGNSSLNNICFKCGKKNESGSKFCEDCGSSLAENTDRENELSSKNCPNCGKNVVLQSKFCDSCGNPLIEGIVKPKTICKFCGSEIPTGAQKCMRCGEWVDKKVEDSRYNGIIAVGYIFTLLGGWIGFIIALYLITRDNKKARKNGYIMLIIALVIAIIVSIFLIAIISTPSYPRYYY